MSELNASERLMALVFAALEEALNTLRDEQDLGVFHIRAKIVGDDPCVIPP